MTTAVEGVGRNGRSNLPCRTDRRTHRMGDSYVVVVLGSRTSGGTRVRQLAPVSHHPLERMGIPLAETEAVHV